jgi:hypothetical protein
LPPRKCVSEAASRAQVRVACVGAGGQAHKLVQCSFLLSFMREPHVIPSLFPEDRQQVCHVQQHFGIGYLQLQGWI